jgi:hypothetical protein
VAVPIVRAAAVVVFVDTAGGGADITPGPFAAVAASKWRVA